MKKKEIEAKNKSLKQQSEDAKKSKANIIDPSDKKFHAPNRPSI